MWWFPRRRCPRPAVPFRLLAGLALVLAPWGAQAQEEPVEGEEVVVTATRAEEDITRVPQSVSVVRQEDIQLGRKTQSMDEPLRQVPGVFTQNQENFAGDLRMSIRGFGARGRFGIQGIQVLVDGIPYTTPDGQSNIDNIDMGTVERIEVLRGPSASLYGGSAGGVVSVRTQRPPERPLVEFRGTEGSFGYSRQQVTFGAPGADGGGVIFNVTNFRYYGFRDHSETEFRNAYGKIVTPLGEDSRLTTVVSHYDSPKAEDPQGLTREQFADDPEQARPGAKRLELGEEVVDSKTGFVYENLVGEDRFRFSLYRGNRVFSNRIPPRIVEFEQRVQGGTLQYNWNSDLAAGNRLILGADYREQNDRRRNFANNDGDYGDLSLNQLERATTLGVFANERIWLSEALQLRAGVRNDQATVRARDHFVTGTNPNDGGERTFGQTTYSAGALYRFGPLANVYVNFGQAFEVPTLTQLDNPQGVTLGNPEGEGGFNPDLDPQTADSYEVGLKGRSPDLAYELVAFRIVAEDEIVLFHLPDSQDDPADGKVDFFRNAGETTRTGLEAALDYRLLATLDTRLSYSYLQAEYEDYETADGDFSGNDIPGIPQNRAHLQVDYKHPSGFYVTPEAEYVDAIPVDDANSEETDAYTVYHLRGGYLSQLGDAPLSVFAGVNNLTDEDYPQNVRINDFGGRYYEPAPPVHYYAGVAIGYVGAR